ncbi:MAG TPA: MFS transporter [Candidatus Elarobacter sp.]|nr:MFS transporter [Candidatus Elarobacter sp.]
MAGDDDGLPLPARRYAILVTALGTLLSMMDVTIANVALPTIAGDLGTSASASIWVVNAYQLTMTMFIVPLGSLGDIVGYGRVYRAGLIVFIIGSIACTASRSLAMLALARAVQGCGAAAMTTTIGALNRHAYPRAMLGRAAGQGALMVAVGAAAGPVVGGCILAVATWPWLFAINVPLGALALALSFRFLPRVAGTRHRFDWPSAALSAASFGLLVATVDAFGHHDRPLVVAAAACATLALGIVFVRRQVRLPVPLFGVDLFAQPVFSLSIVASVTSFIAQTVAYVALPFLFENVLGRSPFATGLLMLPWLLAAATMAPLAGRLSDRYEPGTMAALGMLLLAAGLFALARLAPDASSADVAWRMAICGVGYGLFHSPNNRTILAGAPRERTGAAQGILATARLFGQTLGAAMVALVFGTSLEASRHAGVANTGAITLALALATAFALVAGVASYARRNSLRALPA